MGGVTPPATNPRTPRPSTDRSTSRRWFLGLGVVWLVALLVSGWWGLTHPSPTDREQTTVTAARPVVDEAIARVAAAATADGRGVVAVAGFERVGTCDITVFREGARYRRVLVAVVPPGSEADLLARVADALPASYRAVVSRGDTPRLTADAGFWVLLSGRVVAPGEVRFTADTGDCRSADDVDPTDPVPSVPEAATAQVLSRLGLAAGTRTTASVTCVDGGSLGTVEVRTEPYGGNLADALADLDGTVIVRSPRLYAYRSGDIQVAVRAQDDVTVVTVTTGCQP
jgi:hypothetical protein